MSPYNNNKIGYIPSRKIFKNPFFNFMVEFREEMKGLNLKSNQIAEEAGRRWRTMSADQKLPYVEVATRIKKPITPKRKRAKSTADKKKKRKVVRHYSSSVISEGSRSRSRSPTSGSCTSDAYS